MEAFGIVGKRMVYRGMELFCDTIAQQLPPDEEIDSPHVFPDDFYNQILAASQK